MANFPLIYAEFAQFLHNLRNLCKNPEKSLIMIIEVMSLCSLFCVCVYVVLYVSVDCEKPFCYSFNFREIQNTKYNNKFVQYAT